MASEKIQLIIWRISWPIEPTQIRIKASLEQHRFLASI